MMPPELLHEPPARVLNAALEIEHYSHLIASLMVTIARTNDRAALGALHDELAEALAGIFTLLSHDAAGASLLFASATTEVPS